MPGSPLQTTDEVQTPARQLSGFGVGAGVGCLFAGLGVLASLFADGAVPLGSMRVAVLPFAVGQIAGWSLTVGVPRLLRTDSTTRVGGAAIGWLSFLSLGLAYLIPAWLSGELLSLSLAVIAAAVFALLGAALGASKHNEPTDFDATA